MDMKPRHLRQCVTASCVGALLASTATLVASPALPASAAVLSQTGPAGALAIAQAIVAPSSTLTGASFVTLPPFGTPDGISTGPLGGFPTAGSSFGILTTGNVSSVPDPTAFANTNDGGGSVRGDTAFDISILKLDLSVPSGDNCVGFDFKFLSEEYPGFVGSIYNDAFIAELDNSTWSTNGSTISAPNNFAFDRSGNVVSINSTGLGGLSAANGAGTAFDGTQSYNLNGFAPPGDAGGATGVLRASTQVSPGEHSVYLSIFDQGDHLLDSAVFLDNLTTTNVPDPALNCTSGAHLLGAATTANPITASPIAVSATEGAPLAAPVASFTQAGSPAATASSYGATINWGDGSSSAGSITAEGTGFTVSGAHTYLEEGSYQVTTTVTDLAEPTNQATATGAATVADAPLSASGVSITTTDPLSATVANFTDADPNGTLGDYTASISWGDGTSSAGTVSGTGPFAVAGTHAYAALGPYTVTTHICDVGGACADATSNVLVYGTSAGGYFVVGDRSDTGPVTFWGARWEKANTLSAGSSPAAFKGFADNTGNPVCGTTWSARPGNSSTPPASLPTYMAVIVSSSDSQSGPVISGNAVKAVIVKTDPGYEPDPGHAGTGTVVGEIC
jgi:hypothetical protein